MVTYIFTLPVLQKAAQNGDQVGAFVYGDYGADFYSNGIGAMEDYIKAKARGHARFRAGDDERAEIYPRASEGSGRDAQEASAAAR